MPRVLNLKVRLEVEHQIPLVQRRRDCLQFGMCLTLCVVVHKVVQARKLRDDGDRVALSTLIRECLSRVNRDDVGFPILSRVLESSWLCSRFGGVIKLTLSASSGILR